jgi:hypothetical protein
LKHILAFCACIPTLKSRLNFDWLMRKAIKYLLASLLLFVLTGAVHAEEDKWIDGIKFRYGILGNTTTFKLPSAADGGSIIEVNNRFSHLADPTLSPIAIVLPETLMNSWSFRGAVFEYQDTIEAKDLSPVSVTIDKDTTYLRQLSELRTSLYNNFFSASDKSFADANSNWALSADVASSRAFLGYYLGAFIPAFEYHRFLKVGFGLGAFYAEFSYKLNLCSQYKVTPKVEDGKATSNGHGGECLGKTEIDSASAKGVGLASIGHVTLWERVTKDSIWKLGSSEFGKSLTDITDALKLKNHNKNLSVSIGSTSVEFISYTYRF